MASDEELKKTFEITGDSEGILYFKMTGNVNDVASNIRQAELVAESLEKIFEDNPDRKFKCLADLSPIGKTAHYPSPQARQIYAKILDYPQLEKVALVVPTTLVQAIINFIIHISSKRKSVKLFKNKKEALEWLRK